MPRETAAKMGAGTEGKQTKTMYGCLASSFGHTRERGEQTSRHIKVTVTVVLLGLVSVCARNRAQMQFQISRDQREKGSKQRKRNLRLL